jgi:hypothetical protein
MIFFFGSILRRVDAAVSAWMHQLISQALMQGVAHPRVADRRICRTIGRSVDVALLHLVLKYGVSVLQAFFVLRHCRLAVINWTVDPRAGLKFVELQQLCGTKRGLACSFSAHLDRSHTPDQNEQENLRKSSRIVIS